MPTNKFHVPLVRVHSKKWREKTKTKKNDFVFIEQILDKVVVGCPCSKLFALWFFFLSITGCHTHIHTLGCTLTHMVQLDDGRETNLDLGYVIGRPAKPNQMRRSHSANRSSASLLQLLFCLSYSSSLRLSPSASFSLAASASAFC